MARKLIDLTGATITFNSNKMTYERTVQFFEAVSLSTYLAEPGVPEEVTLNFQGKVGDPEYLNTDFDMLRLNPTYDIALWGTVYYKKSDTQYGTERKRIFYISFEDLLYYDHTPIVDIQPSPTDPAFVKDPIFLSFIEDTCDIEGGVWIEVEDLKQKTASVPDGWSVPAGYMVYDNPCTINGMAASSDKLGYEEGAECADVIEVQTMARAMTHIYPDEPVTLSFENSTESEIYEYELQSFVLDNGGTITSTPVGDDMRIKIGGESIKLIRIGSKLIKEVYSGSDLIARTFHPIIEGYNFPFRCDLVMNGGIIRMPGYLQNAGVPNGQYFSHYVTVDGDVLHPGDSYTFSGDPYVVAEDWGDSASDIPAGAYLESTLCSTDWFNAVFSSDPETEDDPSWITHTCTVTGVYTDNVETGTLRMWSVHQTRSGYQADICTIPYWSTWENKGNIPNGIDYNGQAFRLYGVIRGDLHVGVPTYPNNMNDYLSYVQLSGNMINESFDDAGSMSEWLVVYRADDGNYYNFGYIM